MQAAEASGASRTTIYEAMKSGSLPYKKLGSATLILRDDLIEWIRSLPQGGES
jgi:excisionase family DNA binding protein